MSDNKTTQEQHDRIDEYLKHWFYNHRYGPDFDGCTADDQKSVSEFSLKVGTLNCRLSFSLHWHNALNYAITGDKIFLYGEDRITGFN